MNNTPKESYQQRVVIEKGELEEKIEKLSKFLPSATFKSLPEIDQVLLRRQLAYMEGYSRILSKRINRFNEA